MRRLQLPASAPIIATSTARVFSLVCAAIQLPLLTSLLSPADFGLVAVVTSIAVYFSLASAESDALALQRFPGDSSHRASYWYAANRVIPLSLIIGIVVVLGGVAIGEVGWAFAIVGWGVGIAVTRLVSIAWLSWHSPWRYSGNLMLSTGMRTAALVALVLLGQATYLAVAIAGFASAIASLALSPGLRPFLKVVPRPWTWRFGFHLGISSVAYTFMSSGAILIASLVLISDNVGILVAMIQMAGISSGAVLGILVTILYPRFRRIWDGGGASNVHAETSRIAIGFLGISLLILAVLSFADFSIVRLFIDDEFLFVRVLPVLIVGTALAAIGQAYSWLYQFSLMPGRAVWRVWVSAALSVVFIIVGASAWGMSGASVGILVGFLTYSILMSQATSRDFRSIAAIGLVSAASIAALAIPDDVFWIVVCPSAASIGVVFVVVLISRLRVRSV